MKGGRNGNSGDNVGDTTAGNGVVYGGDNPPPPPPTPTRKY